MSRLLTPRGLTLCYGEKLVLSDVSLELVAGRVTTLIGTNGSGKSTLIKLLCGHLHGTGEIDIKGQPVRRWRKRMLARLGPEAAEAIDEFLAFRIGFRDGEVPREALYPPSSRSLETYVDVVHRTLDGLIGREAAFEVEALAHQGLGVAAVATRFRPANNPQRANDDLILACQAALDHYCKSSANSFVDSLAVAYSDKTTSVTVVKPLEYFRWTIESAFTDSQQIMSAFTAGRA